MLNATQLFNLSIVAPHEYWRRTPAPWPLMKKEKPTGPLINVLHETAATHKRFLPDAMPAVIFCAVTHESDISGSLMNLIYSGSPENS